MQKKLGDKKMKKMLQKLQLKGFIAGMLVMVLLSGVTALATTRTETIDVNFRGIRLVVNNALVTPTDTAGNVIEPFIWDGVTYLPVRAIADALGLDASWNEATSTVYLNGGQAAPPAFVPPPPTTLPPVPEPTPLPAPAPMPEPAPLPTPAPMPEPEPAPLPAPAPTGGTDLVGTWNWMGVPFYTFNASGSGEMSGLPINWTRANNILSICNTPDFCQGNCIAPAEWDYTISGRYLTITSRLIPTMTYTYTRS